MQNSYLNQRLGFVLSLTITGLFMGEGALFFFYASYSMSMPVVLVKKLHLYMSLFFFA